MFQLVRTYRTARSSRPLKAGEYELLERRSSRRSSPSRLYSSVNSFSLRTSDPSSEEKRRCLIDAILHRNVLLHDLHVFELLAPRGRRVHLVVFAEMFDVFWVGEVFFARIYTSRQKRKLAGFTIEVWGIVEGTEGTDGEGGG